MSSMPSQAQRGLNVRRSEAVSAAKNLKDATLVVRLRSNHRKSEALKKELARDLPGGNRQRLQAMLDEVEKTTIAENHGIATGFRQHYNFSKYLLMYDTAMASLKSGVRQGIFLNEQLEPDTSLKISTEFFFLAYYDTSDETGVFGTEGLRIFTQNNEAMPVKFPGFAGRSSMLVYLGKSLRQNTDEYAYEFLVIKLQKRLDKFMEKYLISN